MRLTVPLFVSIGLLLTMAFISIGLSTAIPEGTQLPIHFDWQGNPDGFATPLVALSIIPAAMLVGILAFVVAPLIKPNVMVRPVLYAGLWLLFVLIMALGQGLILRHALMVLAQSR
jgi:uncharacterized membrane protein